MKTDMGIDRICHLLAFYISSWDQICPYGILWRKKRGVYTRMVDNMTVTVMDLSKSNGLLEIQDKWHTQNTACVSLEAVFSLVKTRKGINWNYSSTAYPFHLKIHPPSIHLSSITGYSCSGQWGVCWRWSQLSLGERQEFILERSPATLKPHFQNLSDVSLTYVKVNVIECTDTALNWPRTAWCMLRSGSRSQNHVSHHGNT